MLAGWSWVALTSSSNWISLASLADSSSSISAAAVLRKTVVEKAEACCGHMKADVRVDWRVVRPAWDLVTAEVARDRARGAKRARVRRDIMLAGGGVVVRLELGRAWVDGGELMGLELCKLGAELGSFSSAHGLEAV